MDRSTSPLHRAVAGACVLALAGLSMPTPALALRAGIEERTVQELRATFGASADLDRLMNRITEEFLGPNAFVQTKERLKSQFSQRGPGPWEPEQLFSVLEDEELFPPWILEMLRARTWRDGEPLDLFWLRTTEVTRSNYFSSHLHWVGVVSELTPAEEIEADSIDRAAQVLTELLFFDYVSAAIVALQADCLSGQDLATTHERLRRLDQLIQQSRAQGDNMVTTVLPSLAEMTVITCATVLYNERPFQRANVYARAQTGPFYPLRGLEQQIRERFTARWGASSDQHVVHLEDQLQDFILATEQWPRDLRDRFLTIHFLANTDHLDAQMFQGILHLTDEEIQKGGYALGKAYWERPYGLRMVADANALDTRVMRRQISRLLQLADSGPEPLRHWAACALGYFMLFTPDTLFEKKPSVFSLIWNDSPLQRAYAKTYPKAIRRAIAVLAEREPLEAFQPTTWFWNTELLYLARWNRGRPSPLVLMDALTRDPAWETAISSQDGYRRDQYDASTLPRIRRAQRTLLNFTLNRHGFAPLIAPAPHAGAEESEAKKVALLEDLYTTVNNAIWEARKHDSSMGQYNYSPIGFKSAVELIQTLRDRDELGPASSFAELAGPGIVAALAQALTGARVTAIDKDPELIAFVEARIRAWAEQHPGVVDLAKMTWVRADLDHLREPKLSEFDVLYLFPPQIQGDWVFTPSLFIYSVRPGALLVVISAVDLEFRGGKFEPMVLRGVDATPIITHVMGYRRRPVMPTPAHAGAEEVTYDQVRAIVEKELTQGMHEGWIVEKRPPISTIVWPTTFDVMWVGGAEPSIHLHFFTPWAVSHGHSVTGERGGLRVTFNADFQVTRIFAEPLFEPGRREYNYFVQVVAGQPTTEIGRWLLPLVQDYISAHREDLRRSLEAMREHGEMPSQEFIEVVTPSSAVGLYRMVQSSHIPMSPGEVFGLAENPRGVWTYRRDATAPRAGLEAVMDAPGIAIGVQEDESVEELMARMRRDGVNFKEVPADVDRVLQAARAAGARVLDVPATDLNLTAAQFHCWTLPRWLESVRATIQQKWSWVSERGLIVTLGSYVVFWDVPTEPDTLVIRPADAPAVRGVPNLVLQQASDLAKLSTPLAAYALAAAFDNQLLPPIVGVLSYRDGQGRDRFAVFV